MQRQNFVKLSSYNGSDAAAIFTFELQTDLSTFIQLLRHRANFSTIGDPFVRIEPHPGTDFYLPEDFPEELVQETGKYLENTRSYCESLVKMISPQLGQARAAELAAGLLPLAFQIQFSMCFFFKSFIRFLNLRYVESAPKEVYDVAYDMLSQIRDTGVYNEVLKENGYDLLTLEQSRVTG